MNCAQLMTRRWPCLHARLHMLACIQLHRGQWLHYFVLSHLSSSRYMSLATSYPRVTAHTWQVGYASLYKNNIDIEEWSRWTQLWPKFNLTKHGKLAYIREMGLYFFLCCSFRDWTHKQSVSGLQIEDNRSVRYQHKWWSTCAQLFIDRWEQCNGNTV